MIWPQMAAPSHTATWRMIWKGEHEYPAHPQFLALKSSSTEYLIKGEPDKDWVSVELAFLSSCLELLASCAKLLKLFPCQS